MVNPNTIDQSNFGAAYLDGQVNVHEIHDLQPFLDEQYDLFDEKSRAKYINDCERAIRTSYEYRRMVDFFRTNDGMNCCTFLSNLSNLDSTKITIHLHHTPLTLYDVVAAVITKHIRMNESLSVFAIAKEVMWLHYHRFVGLIPVCETVHQMIHNQIIIVPTYVVNQQYIQFVHDYYDFIDPDTLRALEDLERLSMQYLNNPNDISNLIYRQFALFNISPTYVKMVGTYIVPPDAINTTKQIIKHRIIAIRRGKAQLYHVINPNVTC